MLASGNQQLIVNNTGVRLQTQCTAYETATPIHIRILNGQRIAEDYAIGYDNLKEENGVCECTAYMETPAGTKLAVLDHWAPDPDGFSVRRSVRVESSRGGDLGYASELILTSTRESALNQYDVFAPGVWYRHNEGVVAGAFASSMNDRDYLFRETRLALPYVQLQDRGSGSSIALCKVAPAPTCGISEISSATLVDASLQYASLGIRAAGKPGVRVCFPGCEGETTYIDGLKQTRGWAMRYHPVTGDAKHEYTVVIALQDGPVGPHESMRFEWRRWYGRFRPAIHPADLTRVYHIGTELLDVYTQEYNGAMGLPFWSTVPQGTVCDLSFQMGFVGQQPMCAYHLMREGISNHKPEMVAKGRGIIDFWVKRSREGTVLPRVWYDVFPPRFKQDYPTYLRTVSDGMEGILLCFQYLARELHETHDNWLAFVTDFCDWLAAHQGDDGSFCRAYTPDGVPEHTGKFNTSNVVRLLCCLYGQTGRTAYRDAALKAGDYCNLTMYEPISYIGGTADNDNTIDKEAGIQALYAFEALYDLTGDAKWLRAACGAADFTETWTYCQSYKVEPCKGNAVFDKADITGLSLIATGHSHADVMMSYCAYDFYRLYLWTDDTHYLDFARLLLHNTKQTVDWSGRLGHVYPGLVEESGELARQYHNGLGRWLPWCTIALIEPLSRLEEQFGAMDIDELERDHDKAKRDNRARPSAFLA